MGVLIAHASDFASCSAARKTTLGAITPSDQLLPYPLRQ
ncbi:hypothetical protein ABIC31_002910 [Paraburkholderia caledonica]